MYLIQRINLPSIEAIQMTALGNKKNINRGKYFSVDKILKEHTIKNTKDRTLTIHGDNHGINTGMTV